MKPAFPVILALVSAGCGASVPFPRPYDLAKYDYRRELKWRASVDLRCDAKKLSAIEDDEYRVRVSGCGKTAWYRKYWTAMAGAWWVLASEVEWTDDTAGTDDPLSERSGLRSSR